MGERSGSCLLVEDEPDDVLKVGALLATARFMMAWSFMATIGPGSAIRALTSTCLPLSGTTSMMSPVAVSLA